VPFCLLVCQAGKHGKNAHSATVEGERVLPVGDLARFHRVGRLATIAGALGLSCAPNAVVTEAGEKLFGLSNEFSVWLL